MHNNTNLLKKLQKYFNCVSILIELAKMLGETKITQRKSIKSRMERMQQLKEENERRGVEMSEEKLAETVEVEEENEKNRKQVCV